ncbi:MAG: hypothetical protein ABSG65_08870 [Bryobacteraceae bacterium]
MDVAITVVLALVQGVFGWAGAVLSLKTWSARARRRFAILFVTLPLLSTGLIGWLAVRGNRSSEQSKKAILGDAEHPPFLAVISMPGFTRFVTNNGSDYPAYGIKIQLYDDADSRIVVRSYDYSEMPAHSAFVDDVPWVPPDEVPEHHFTGYITTRAGLFTQELILRHAESNQWSRASRVRQGMRTLEEDVDSSWPRDKNGRIGWK